MPKPIKETMTPKEVATFWYNEAQKLQATVENLTNEIAEKDAMIADMKTKFSEAKSSVESARCRVTKIDEQVDNLQSCQNCREVKYFEDIAKKAYNKISETKQLMEDYQKRSTSYYNLAHEYRDALKVSQLTIADKDNQIRELTPKMTYEQIIDIKCENARLREENAKFAKWKRILDKFKIF